MHQFLIPQNLTLTLCFKSCIIQIKGRHMLRDLILSDMRSIFSQEWTDWHTMQMWIVLQKRWFLDFQENLNFDLYICLRVHSPSRVISTIRANQLLHIGCQVCLINVLDTRKDYFRLKRIPIVKEFTNAFMKPANVTIVNQRDLVIY